MTRWLRKWRAYPAYPVSSLAGGQSMRGSVEFDMLRLLERGALRARDSCTDGHPSLPLHQFLARAASLVARNVIPRLGR
jgi:hypothetical protein